MSDWLSRPALAPSSATHVYGNHWQAQTKPERLPQGSPVDPFAGVNPFPARLDPLPGNTGLESWLTSTEVLRPNANQSSVTGPLSPPTASQSWRATTPTTGTDNRSNPFALAEPAATDANNATTPWQRVFGPANNSIQPRGSSPDPWSTEALARGSNPFSLG
ncbi:MAG: hypothetical protein SFZ03_02655 [Candidatus Melainabacteria bacterium]|nr:hypothetical protein [Candidatus Melainabacteria bacterium]